MKMRYILNRLRRPGHAFAGLLRRLWFIIPNDKIFVSLIYWLETGRWANFKNPRLFTEKIQWLKLYDRRVDYVKMVDKIRAKDYVASIIGSKFVIETLGVWNHFDEIDFSQLPKQFVLKTNHGGGNSVMLCMSKETFDKKKAERFFERLLRCNGYWAYREWPYKSIEPKIFAERMLLTQQEEIIDYKFFCFDGEPRFCQVIMNRRTKETIDFFDMKLKHQEFVGLNPGIKNSDITPSRPKHFEEMKEIAKKLSKGISFVRIDLYDTEEQPYFGEITFYPASGLGKFVPSTYDNVLGKMILLPSTENVGM